MAVDAGTIATLMVEVAQGIKTAQSTIPPSPEIADLRVALVADYTKMKHEHPTWGWDVPLEWPEVQIPAPKTS